MCSRLARRMAATSSVMSIPTGHHVMQRPQPTQPRRAELVDPPGRELVRQPLAVPRARRRAHRATMHVAKSRVKQESQRAERSAVSPSRSVHVLHGRAEAGRADQRAVGAGQAAIRHVVPARVLEIVGGALLDAVGVERPPHPRGALSTARSAASRSALPARRQLGSSRAPPAVPTSTRKRWPSRRRSSVKARSPPRLLRPCAHRDAEAGASWLGAVDRDHESSRRAA